MRPLDTDPDTGKIMVSIALYRGVAQSRLHGQVLRQRDRTDIGQIFTTHLQRKLWIFAHALGEQTTISETMNDALAVFVAHADVAQLQRLAQITFGAT